MFPLVLLPGLSGDPRVFEPQRVAFANLVVPRWISPEPYESLCEFARRMASHLDPGPCVIGGVSFGGIVALEMTRFLDARACILVATVRSRSGLPLALRVASPVVSRASDRTLHRAMNVASASGIQCVKEKGDDRDASRFRAWALRALARWRPAEPSCILRQIHGERDRTFRARASGADVILPGAGHLLTRTHAAAVNAFIEGVCRETA